MTLRNPPEAPPAGELRRVGELITGYRSAQLLFAAVSLDLFSALREPREAQAVAVERRLDPRACEVLLDALAALGFLVKEHGRYRNAPVAEAALRPDSPASLYHNLRTQHRLSAAWASLADTVRQGAPAVDLLQRLWDPGFTRDYILGMAEIARRPAQEIASILSTHKPLRLLDVGGGPASYSLALLDAIPALHADLLDLPNTLAVARERANGHERLSFREGDYRKADFGSDRYDLVLLSHVTHDESEADTERLFKKAHAALRAGGRVAVHDFMLEPERTRPLFPALFAAHMLAYTASGRTYTEEEYAAWLTAAGFRDLQRFPVCADAPNATVLLVGRKP